MTFAIKAFRVINVLFIAEMFFLSLGLKLKLISFGMEVQAAMTELFIMLGLIISIITFLGLRRPETKVKKMLVCVMGAIMLFVGMTFILDNTLRLVG